MNPRDLPFDQRVDDRITALLARCDRIRRGSDIGRPTSFDERGEAHARAVAARDMGGSQTLARRPFVTEAQRVEKNSET